MKQPDKYRMRRVCVIGPCGAGKSTFSRKLAGATGLPLTHLDQVYWRPGWQKPGVGEWPQQVHALISKDRWIIDGNYHSTLDARLARADTVISLDYPRRIYLWRALKRIVLNYGRVRPDSAPGCPERFDLAFLLYLWRFPRDSRPKTLDALDRFRAAGDRGRRVYVISNPRMADEFLENLA